MDAWKFESHAGKQTLLALVCMGAGFILAMGFRHFDRSGMSNSLAGFLLGALLLVIGSTAFLMRGTQTIVIDPRLRRIVVEDAFMFGNKKTMIPFNDIVETGIGYFGKRSNFVKFYYINLKLKDGKTYPLFAPGRFYEGGSDRSIMESRLQRLDEAIRQSAGGQTQV